MQAGVRPVSGHDYARDLREYSGLPVLVHGQSLGSFMAGEVARQRSLDGLVLESSATTAEDWVKGFVDANPFVRRGVVEGGLQGQGNLALMSVLDEPLLIVVGEHDRTTRPAMSQRLFEVARLPPTMKELLVVPDAGHNDASAHPSFAAAIVRLLARGDRGVKLSSRISPVAGGGRRCRLWRLDLEQPKRRRNERIDFMDSLVLSPAQRLCAIPDFPGHGSRFLDHTDAGGDDGCGRGAKGG